MLKLLHELLALAYLPPGAHYACQQYVEPMALRRAEALLWSRDAQNHRCNIPPWLRTITGPTSAGEIRNAAQVRVARRIFSPRRPNREPRVENYGRLRSVNEPPAVYKGQQIEVEEPEILDCDAPRAGWLGAVSTSIIRPRVQFDGGFPVTRSGREGTVPEIGETLTFSTEQPTTLFNQATPCYFQALQRCSTTPASGTFVVAGRVWYNAGPGGSVRWQLCLIREEEVSP